MVGAASCTSAVRQYDLIDRPMTCEDANRTAYRTLQAMRFTVGEFQPAEPGRPGVMHGQRTTKEDHRSVTVRITCTATGATVDATEDGEWLEQMEIKRSFHHAFTNIVSMRAAQEELDAKVVAGTAPPRNSAATSRSWSNAARPGQTHRLSTSPPPASRRCASTSPT
jgi:hypothetical protein